MFRFTIRDVLWLTVVVALALGWGIVQIKYFQLSQRVNTLQWKLDKLVKMVQSRGYSISVEGGVGMSSKPIKSADTVISQSDSKSISQSETVRP
jgi:hypothetical protein